MKQKTDVAVIGGGPAGLAAAIAAYKGGASVLILERDDILGGILNQCIHSGFGLHYFKEELTGPEYAARFANEVAEILASEGSPSGIDNKRGRFRVMTKTMVTGLSADRKITAVNADGIIEIDAGAVVLAMGCRERTRGAINIPGSRPAGVMTAGCAQRLINLEGKMIGRRAVILGSGDIGLIMARRLTYEGAKVLLVAEIMSYSSGLQRNIAQCLDDNDIPLFYNTTVTRIEGKDRLTGVELAEVDAARNIIESTRRFVECDTLLLSVGLIPENELTQMAGLSIDRITGGAVVDQDRHTQADGVFACGNVLHVHDLVDNVTAESAIAGAAAARFVSGELKRQQGVKVLPSGKVRYCLPQNITSKVGETEIYFRVSDKVRPATITVVSGNKEVKRIKKQVLLPGEMEKIKIGCSGLSGDVTVSVG